MKKEETMTKEKKGNSGPDAVADLIDALNEDLSREYQAIIATTVYSIARTPTATAKPVKLSKKAEEMLRFDLDNETETIKNYRQRVKQAEALGHYALAEHLRKLIAQEQEHQHDLATALGIDVPKVLEGGA